MRFIRGFCNYLFYNGAGRELKGSFWKLTASLSKLSASFLDLTASLFVLTASKGLEDRINRIWEGLLHRGTSITAQNGFSAKIRFVKL